MSVQHNGRPIGGFDWIYCRSMDAMRKFIPGRSMSATGTVKVGRAREGTSTG